MNHWFPCRSPEEVRSAQSLAFTRHSRGIAGAIGCALAVGVFVQLWAGTGWMALVWTSFAALLPWQAANQWRKTQARRSPKNNTATRATLYAFGFGSCWASALVLWPTGIHDVALLAAAISLAFISYATAGLYFAPVQVMAFSAPVVVAALYLLVDTLQGASRNIGLLLVGLHVAGTLWFLRSNWTRFVDSVEADAERLRMSSMLQEQKEIAERAVQLKTRFLAAASHDLRQPMHAISLYLGGLSELDLPPRAAQAVVDACECAHDLNDMFRSLLDISRLDAQQAVPDLSVFCIATVLSRVGKEFAPLAHSRSVDLKVRIRGDYVYSDPVMIERIAQNFVSNAIRHANGGRVLAGCRVRGNMLRLAVYDNGKGIPLAQQEAIFDEFQQIDPKRDKDHTGGLGLGLAIVRRLAQTLRTPVTVRSQPSRGSMFAIDLPLVQACATATHTEVPSTGLHGRLVIVVDDDASVLDAASFALSQAGCDVLSAGTPQAAMQALAGSNRTPDAIVCDYELKTDLEGPDVIRAIRDEFNSEIPALLVTGHTGGDIAEKRARELGVPLLYKPLEATALRRSLGTLLSLEGH